MEKNEYPLLKNSLPPAIRKVWLIDELFSWIVLSGVILVIWVIVAHFWQPDWLKLVVWILLGVLLVMSVGSIVTIPYRYHFERFEIHETEIAIQKGFFFRTTTYVPIARIQHLEIEQGPLLRWQQLAALKIHTAATAHEIGGLKQTDAQQLRRQIINLVRVVKEDV